MTYSHVQAAPSLPTIMIYYSRPDCPYCDKLEALLKERNVPNIKYVVDVDFTREQLRAMLPHVEKLTFPQAFYGADHVGGYTDCVAFFEHMDAAQAK